MAKSQVIKDLATNKISLEETLQRLLVIIMYLGNYELENWITEELNGYRDKSKIPIYRRNIGYRLLYSGINGNFQITNNPLPIEWLPKQLRDSIDSIDAKESIRIIEKVIENKERVANDLTYLASLIYKDTGVQCTKIIQEYSNISYQGIVSNVKTKLLQILINIEQEFGELDSLDINLESKTEEQVGLLNEKIKNVISFDGMQEEYTSE
ncbi:hypothetical protein [Trichococcus shcherbakoviae]|uniref:AbiTii domain-containing protein n=1 Tax=Trichococcus shcherbakoviae TaxID=2094020 RepID=UPI0029F48315|nr:hypothetical protein [Trichococcus shcherbakoviae]